LEHVNPAVTSRVVAVDINPKYLLRLRERFPNQPSNSTSGPGCGDVELSEGTIWSTQD
jgi:hypothetical protein